jgi:hypothetical protein
MEEGDEVERVVDLRVSLATGVEHLDDLELASGEGALLDQEFGGRCLRLAECGRRLVEHDPALVEERVAHDLGRLGGRGLTGDIRARVEDSGGSERIDILQDGGTRNRLPGGVRTSEADAVDHPDDAHQHHPTGERSGGHEERESRTHVGRHDAVDAATQDDDTDDDGEETSELGLPADCQQRHGHRLRT